MENVRSVGGTNNEVTPYYTKSTNFNSWFKGNKASVPSGDMQYELDFVKLSYFGKLATTNNYWLASRYVDETSSGVNFNVRCVDTVGYLYDDNLWYVLSSGSVDFYNPISAVRPVVINPSGI